MRMVNSNPKIVSNKDGDLWFSVLKLFNAFSGFFSMDLLVCAPYKVSGFAHNQTNNSITSIIISICPNQFYYVKLISVIYNFSYHYIILSFVNAGLVI